MSELKKNLSKQAGAVLDNAQLVALGQKHQFIYPVHLLGALLNGTPGVVSEFFLRGPRDALQSAIGRQYASMATAPQQPVAFEDFAHESTKLIITCAPQFRDCRRGNSLKSLKTCAQTPSVEAVHILQQLVLNPEIGSLLETCGYPENGIHRRISALHEFRRVQDAPTVLETNGMLADGTRFGELKTVSVKVITRTVWLRPRFAAAFLVASGGTVADINREEGEGGYGQLDEEMLGYLLSPGSA